jgi:NAD(P)H-hydrate epimerase
MFLTRDEARALDRRAMEKLGVPGIVLMENAGRGMAELLVRLGVHGGVAICCGKGNNGGDGLVIARHLANGGVGVRVLVFARPEELPADAAAQYQIVARSPIALEVISGELHEERLREELEGSEWVVDALFGSGLRGPVHAPFDGVIHAINASPARVLAVDIPSGLDSDTGLPLGVTVRATHTATVVAPKKGFNEPASREWVGRIHVISMGVPVGI